MSRGRYLAELGKAAYEDEAAIDVGSLPVLIMEENIDIQYWSDIGVLEETVPNKNSVDLEGPVINDVTVNLDDINKNVQIVAIGPDNDVPENQPGVLEETVPNENSVDLEGPVINDVTVNLDDMNENVQIVAIGPDNDVPENQPPKSKRKRGEGPWVREKRKERTKNRHEGKGYVTVKGREVQERKMTDLKACRMECSKKLNEELRKTIFDEYWALGSRDRRVQFISSLIDVEETKTTRKRKIDSNKNREVTFVYNFSIKGQRTKVCKSCFSNTLDEHNKFIALAVANKMQSTSGTTTPDQRGRHSPINKHSQELIDGVINHIKSFPTYESHYTRKTNSKLYLPSHLNLSKLYSLYCEQTDNPVSQKIYEREFHKLNLRFKMRKTDTCHKCEIFKMKLQTCENEDERNEIVEEQKKHHESADFAYSAKKIDKERAKEDKSTKCFAFDLQQCLPTPDLQTSVSFYKRLYWTYNLTVHDLATNETTCYLWHEAVANRGANEIASCIYQHILGLDDNVKTVVLYSDTCGGQNKNSHVASMFTYLLQVKPSLEEVHHKFLVPGHTHMECDSDHSAIERQKKKTETLISHPHDWATLIRCTNKKFKVIEMDQENFLDFSGLLSKTGPLVLKKTDASGNKFYWRPCCWFKYTSSFGEVLFKTSLDESDIFHTFSMKRRTRRHLVFFARTEEVICWPSSRSTSKEERSHFLVECDPHCLP